DYAQVLAAMNRQRFPAFVSYDQRTTASTSGFVRGFGLGDADESGTYTVRTSDGAVVERPGSHKGSTWGDEARGGAHESNPVTRPAFVIGCYVPQSEDRDTMSGHPALRFTLAPVRSKTCGGAGRSSDHDTPFTTLYADPVTYRPIAATGSFDDSHVKVDLAEDFDTIAGRTLPTRITVNVKGSGLMFWLHVRAEQTYSNYQFETSRRQASSPKPRFQ
ncbi:MAG: hypothetical protein M3M96_00435, partial [Candidatus Eremiobacteraeota bacterium]|nr:hypothetical protein [Candidatus Eremiobacteraeota bacterium]